MKVRLDLLAELKRLEERARRRREGNPPNKKGEAPDASPSAIQK